jgi:alkylation response protein AidB-like acyl-CoA dehydrogenase
MNLTEPQAGSDVGALKTRAVPNGDGTYRIKGRRSSSPSASTTWPTISSTSCSPALPDAPPGTKGISLFLVPKFRSADGTPNDVRCVSIEHKLGIHASPTCVMSFGDDGDASAG